MIGEDLQYELRIQVDMSQIQYSLPVGQFCNPGLLPSLPCSKKERYMHRNMRLLPS